jgi:hypothetical protein
MKLLRPSPRWCLANKLDWLTGSHAERVIQGTDVRIARALAFLQFLRREIRIRPVWLMMKFDPRCTSGDLYRECVLREKGAYSR